MAAAEGVDAVGYYMAPWGYAQPQVLKQAIEGTKSVEHKKLADYIRVSTFKTVLGDVKFGKDGEWAESRVLQIQFHDVKANDVEQFRTMNTQTAPATDCVARHPRIHVVFIRPVPAGDGRMQRRP